MNTITEFSKRSDLISLSVVTLHISSVLAALYVAAIFGIGPHLVLCWIWFGFGMNGLLNLMHECTHFHTFNKRSASVFLGRNILGPLALADFDGYQKRHWEHHRSLGEDTDPKYIYREDIRGWRFVRFLFKCLFLSEAFKKFFMQTKYTMQPEASPVASGWWFLRTVIVQAILAGSVFLVAWAVNRGDLIRAIRVAALSYGFVYLYGIASLTLFASGLRAMAEHQIGIDQGDIVNQAALRNFSAGPVLTIVMGAYGFTDHATHHQEPAIPYYRLKAKTKELASRDVAFQPRFSYGATIASLIRQS